jgi:trehalose 6-phosphate phosphatase
LHNVYGNEVVSAFLCELREAPASVLLLDYDGTLAPFQLDRAQAYSYPGVLPLVENIVRSNRTKVIVISGRPVVELKTLLRPLNHLELWGSHGLERELSDGSYRTVDIPLQILTLLSRAQEWLAGEGLSSRAEIKPGGVAVHWRGMSDAEVKKIEAVTQMGLGAFANSGLKLLPFEAGLELRVAHPNKGDVVSSILEGLDPEVKVAYLGDDLTDEDAFRALAHRGLTVLVRREFRKTSAQAWLKPPEELLGFLERWCSCLSAWGNPQT